MFCQKDHPESVYDNGQGVVRKVPGHEGRMMMVQNDFETGAVGAMHAHPHEQCTYVLSGRFLFTIGEEKREVAAGDALHKDPGVPHGCICLEKGSLLDVFTPIREDFLS